jgi:hypothetical protein
MVSISEGIPMKQLLDKLPLPLIIVMCLTLGLAPFAPEPHVWQKLQMLVSGSLSKPVDIFDMLMHGIPWILLVLKLTIRR